MELWDNFKELMGVDETEASNKKIKKNAIMHQEKTDLNKPSSNEIGEVIILFVVAIVIISLCYIPLNFLYNHFPSFSGSGEKFRSIEEREAERASRPENVRMQQQIDFTKEWQKGADSLKSH